MSDVTKIGNMTVLAAADIADITHPINTEQSSQFNDQAGVGKVLGRLYLRDNGSNNYDLVMPVTSGASGIWVRYASAPDLSQELTASGAALEGIKSLELNHATVIVAATVVAADFLNTFLMIKDTSASGTAAHTATISGGTWDGTNTIMTLNAPNEAVMVYIDSAGDGTVIENVGTVVLS